MFPITALRQLEMNTLQNIPHDPSHGTQGIWHGQELAENQGMVKLSRCLHLSLEEKGQY